MILYTNGKFQPNLFSVICKNNTHQSRYERPGSSQTILAHHDFSTPPLLSTLSIRVYRISRVTNPHVLITNSSLYQQNFADRGTVQNNGYVRLQQTILETTTKLSPPFRFPEMHPHLLVCASLT